MLIECVVAYAWTDVVDTHADVAHAWFDVACTDTHVAHACTDTHAYQADTHAVPVDNAGIDVQPFLQSKSNMK